MSIIEAADITLSFLRDYLAWANEAYAPVPYGNGQWGQPRVPSSFVTFEDYKDHLREHGWFQQLVLVTSERVEINGRVCTTVAQSERTHFLNDETVESLLARNYAGRWISYRTCLLWKRVPYQFKTVTNPLFA